MSGGTVGAYIVGGAIAAASAAASVYSSNKQAKAQEAASKRAEQQAKEQAAQQRQQQRKQGLPVHQIKDERGTGPLESHLRLDGGPRCEHPAGRSHVRHDGSVVAVVLADDWLP